MKVSIIVAHADESVIGAENKLLWHLPDDLKNFKKITMGHMIVMGRKTWDSIGRPLPGRKNAVITRDSGLQIEDVLIFHSLKEAIDYAKEKNEEEIFIIGGEQIYRLALPMADKLYLTRVYGSFEGDAYFPEIDPDQWKVDSKIIHPGDEKHAYPFDTMILSRK
jgi:dihydrofolate reductase